MKTKSALALLVIAFISFAAYAVGLIPRLGNYGTFLILPSVISANAEFADLSTGLPLTQGIKLPKILERACSCESWGNPNQIPRQFNSDGSILWGQENDFITGKTIIVKRDVGACQINMIVHHDEIASLEFDVVNSIFDNETFALVLYNKYGMKPWTASKSCWNQSY